MIVREILKKHGLTAKKFFGQNFLIDDSVVSDSILAAKLSCNDHVIEVGPGLGVLTKQLAQTCKKVTAIELDKQLLPILREELIKCRNIEIIHQDALKFIPPKSPYKVVANIPYNITSPLINHFLQSDNPPISITILIQKEVAQKICQLNPKMSVLALQVALFGNARIIRQVPPNAFHPAPKVQSSIIHINFDPKFKKEKAIKILNIAKRAFKSGRKKLSNTLPDLKDKLLQLNLQEKRPQHLSMEDWAKLI